MAELIVGSKGELAWDKDEKGRILAATGSWAFRERARNAALDWRDARVYEALKRHVPRIASQLKTMTDLGFSASTPVHRQVGTMRHNEGKFIGVESNRSWGEDKAPVYHSLRIDVDDAKALITTSWSAAPLKH